MQGAAEQHLSGLVANLHPGIRKHVKAQRIAAWPNAKTVPHSGLARLDSADGEMRVSRPRKMRTRHEIKNRFSC